MFNTKHKHDLVIFISESDINNIKGMLQKYFQKINAHKKIRTFLNHFPRKSFTIYILISFKLQFNTKKPTPTTKKNHLNIYLTKKTHPLILHIRSKLPTTQLVFNLPPPCAHFFLFFYEQEIKKFESTNQQKKIQ